MKWYIIPGTNNKYEINKDGKLIKIHNSVKEACIAIGVNSRSPLISYACRGKCSTNNCNTAYGYKWSSVDGDIVQPHN